MTTEAAAQAHDQFIDRLIAGGALWSPRLIAAFRETPRHCFLDRVFVFQRQRNQWKELITRDPGPRELPIVYSDRALITHLSSGNQGLPARPISSSSQPSLMAAMLEDLDLQPGHRVLEVGSGTGYNAALMAHVVGPGLTTTVDVDRNVLSEAWDHLRHYPDRKVEVLHADGRLEIAERSPFDRLIVTAAARDLEPAWLTQVTDGGAMVVPLALAPGLGYVVRGQVRGGQFEGRLTRPAYFMALRNEDEAGESDAEAGWNASNLRTISAPWAGWFDRGRSHSQAAGLIQSLVFYAWLRGLAVHYQALFEGEPAYGVSWTQDPEELTVTTCWFRRHDWLYAGDKGHDLALALWRAFLNAGRPWPSEFVLRADPLREPSRDLKGESYRRSGLHCRQVWELQDRRERPSWP